LSTANAPAAPVRHPLPPWPFCWSAIIVVLLLGARVIEIVPIPIPRCTFRVVTGWPCLTCGFTRCLRALSHCDLALALRWNPLVCLCLLGLLVSPLFWPVLRRARWPEPVWARRALTLAAVVVALLNWSYLLRNGV